jgi:hypothetical protein
MAVQIQLRRDTAANWTSENPTLAAGEAGFETTTAKLKIGDGSSDWNSLPYFGGEGGSGPTDTDELTEGSTNLYHTTSRARAAAVVDSLAGSQTDQAPSVLSTATALAAKANATHASAHQSGGSDPIKLDDLATPDDNSDLNASTSRHGLLRKLSSVATEILNGAGNWVTGVFTNQVQAWAKAQRYTPQTLTDGASITYDVASGPDAELTLTAGSHTLSDLTNSNANDCGQLWVIGGGYTLLFNAAWKWPDSVVAPDTAVATYTLISWVRKGSATYATYAQYS